MSMLTLAVLACAGLQESAAEGLELELRPPPSPLQYFVTHELVTQMTVGETQFKMKIDLELELELHHAGSSPHRFELTFGHLRGAIEAPFGGTVDFDSQDGKTEYPGMFGAKVLQLKMLAGKTIVASVSPHGQVERVQGYAEIYAGTPIEQELKRGGELLTNESFLNDVQFLFARLPEQPVRKGERWVLSYPFTVFEDEITFLPRYSLQESVADTARWSFLTVVDEADPGASGEPLDAQAKRGYVTEADVRNASLQGECVVSRNDGLALRQTAEVVLDLKMPNPLSGDPIPGVVIQRVEVRRLAAGDKPPGHEGAAPR